MIDVLIVGDVDMDKIQALRTSLEKEIKRKIRVLVMGTQEFAENRDMLMTRPNWRIL